MKDDARRIEVIKYWRLKAEESLEAARREYEAGAYDFALNRLYYASFYAVSAILLERDLNFKKHSGVRAAFHQEIIKNGLLDIEWGKFYDQLFEDRQESDYLALFSVDSDYVKKQLELCTEFLQKLRSLMH